MDDRAVGLIAASLKQGLGLGEVEARMHAQNIVDGLIAKGFEIVHEDEDATDARIPADSELAEFIRENDPSSE